MMTQSDRATELLADTPALLKHITGVLNDQSLDERLYSKNILNSSTASSVLFLLGCHCGENKHATESCLVLNKRSLKVRQAGDLCCPGGSISSRLDFLLAKMLSLPGSPLARWSYRHVWRKRQSNELKNLALLLAAGLREGFEEMHLNPFGVQLLGPLSPERLVMFQRVIYPFVCWISTQKQFKPNWEVEKILYIPLRELLDHDRYARYRLHIDTTENTDKNRRVKEFRCFIHHDRGETERLWGATFRITMRFLELVFGFDPPDIDALPTVEGRLDENYLTGNG